MAIDMGARKWWAAGALAVVGLVIGIDGTVLNLALPTLAADLHATTAQLQWFVDAYLLVLGAAMLPAGLVGDRYGRRRLLLVALAMFAVGSLACAYASSPEALILARALLGLGAAFILPLSIGVVPVLFAAHERERAIAVVAGSAVVAYPFGPLLGGWLLNHYWWGSVFLINVPGIAIAMLAVWFLMPESRGSERLRLDPLGIVLSTIGLVALTYGAIEAGQDGWGDVRAATFMVCGAVVLTAFAWWEVELTGRVRAVTAGSRPGRQPLIDVALFRSAGFIWGTVLVTLMSFVMIGLLFAVPQYLQAILGYDAMGAGIRLLPLIGGMIIGLGLGNRISVRIGAKYTVAAGFMVTAVGYGVAALTDLHDGTGYLALWITIVGFGLGAVMPSAMNAAVVQLTEERSGVGSALVAAGRQIGATFGVAILGSVLNGAYRDRLDLTELPAEVAGPVRDGVTSGIAVAHRMHSDQLLSSVQHAFVHGLDMLLAVSGGMSLLAVVLALGFLPRQTTPPSRVAVVPDQEPVELSLTGRVPWRPRQRRDR